MSGTSLEIRNLLNTDEWCEIANAVTGKTHCRSLNRVWREYPLSASDWYPDFKGSPFSREQTLQMVEYVADNARTKSDVMDCMRHVNNKSIVDLGKLVLEISRQSN